MTYYLYIIDNYEKTIKLKNNFFEDKAVILRNF